MKRQEKKEKAYKGFLMGAGVAAALALSLVFLFACGVQDNAPSRQTAGPSVSGTQAPPAASAAAVPTAEPAPAELKEEAEYLETAVCVANESLHIRDSAGTDGKIIGALPAGESAGVRGYADGWAQIDYNGVSGFASMEYLVFKRAPEVSVPEGEWTQILVNRQSTLPADFSVELADFAGGQVDARILAVCEAMFADAKKDGVTFKLVDAYRSRELQSALFEDKVESYIAKGYSREQAESEAATITARPDTSEHQTGLALDIVTPSHTSRNSAFAATKAYAWLSVNAAAYGFVLRYPEGKTEFTGVIYEPWHWRFAGTAAAAEMKRSGASLEEYLEAAQ